MGLPPTDGRLIRPSTTPILAEVRFDWNESLQNSLVRRAELRRQKWNIRRRELELIAARNLRRPRLDLVVQYGWRGFGDELFGERSRPEGSAFRDLYIGDLQDWQLGLEFQTPIGNRIGCLAVRNAELQLAREQALLREQERHVAHELAEAFTEVDRAYASARSTYNARVAAKEERDAIAERVGVTEGPFFLLDAQQRTTDAETAFYRSVIDYNQALLDLQYIRGTMLDNMQVSLTEGPWSEIAHYAAAKQSRRFRSSVIGHVRQDVPPVTLGTHDQQPNQDWEWPEWPTETAEE
jgi:outer membrane protein TolC